MTLPNISIPLNIPIDIPTMLHPPLVHFAVAIPVLVLLFEVINLFLKSKSLKIITSSLLFLTIAILFGAYLTGTADGKAVMDSGSFGGVADLKEHKLLGIYLVYASAVIFIFKLLSLVINKTGFRVFYVLLLIGFTASVLHQGKEGGELVYKHGANVKQQSDDFDDDEKTEEKAEEKTTPPTKEEETTKAPEETEKETKENTEKLTPLPNVTKEVEKKAEEIKDEIKTVETNTSLVTPIKSGENNNSHE